MQIDVLTLFPDFFSSPLNTSILKRSQEKVSFNLVNIRDFTLDKHKKADDKTFGGGCGMVMKAQPIFDAIESLKLNEKTKIIMLCPTGEKYTQKKALELSKEDRIVFICGHYEGIDERVRTHLVNDEISIGDYVLTGGEVATLTVIDSIVRLIPEVLGNEDSAIEDSFSDGLLDCPHYTRPSKYKDWSVPDILVGGNHSKINEWRLKEKIKTTLIKRFDLIEKYDFKDINYKLIQEIIDDIKSDNNLVIEEFKIQFLKNVVSNLKLTQSKKKTKISLESLNWSVDNKYKLEEILNKNVFKNKKVILDFDNTIISRDLGEYSFLKLIEYNLINIDKVKSLSPDFIFNEKEIILGQTVNPFEYYLCLMESLKVYNNEESEIINGYIWLVQALSGLSLRQIIDININISEKNNYQSLNDKKNIEPFFQPEIIDLIGKLLINNFNVYIVSASNTWIVRYIVINQLNKILNEKFKKNIKISSENIYGVSTLIKDKRSGSLNKDINLLKQNQKYKNMDLEELDNYILTSHITYPVSTFEGKAEIIKKYILKNNEKAFLTVGDSPNDIPMLKLADYKLWIQRTEKEEYKKYLNRVTDNTWIIQNANTIQNPGFII